MKVYDAKVEETYRHKETGEVFKERKDWEAKGYKPEDMAQDVKLLCRLLICSRKPSKHRN